MSLHTTVIPDEQFFERQRRFHDFLDAPVHLPISSLNMSILITYIPIGPLQWRAGL